MINNQPHSGVFQTTCPILGKTKGLFIFLFINNFHLTYIFFVYIDKDTVSKINKRLSRSERNVKDEKKVQLYRFEDPILGPRKNPTLENPLDGKILLDNKSQFKIDLQAQKVFVDDIDIGEVLIYRLIE